MSSEGGSSGVEYSNSVVSWRYWGHTGILCYMGFKEVLRPFIALSSMYTACLTSVIMVFQDGLGCLCIFHAYSSSGLAGRGSLFGVGLRIRYLKVNVLVKVGNGDIGWASPAQGRRK